MRNRFELQLSIGQRPIEQTPISPKCKDALEELIAALKAIYCNKEYNQKVFSVLENYISKGKKKTGRKGMDLWQVFVLAQVRLCLGASYDRLENLANNHLALRWLMGVECEYGFNRITFEYQNIYDNVTMLSDELIQELNALVLEFGHSEVFKKKGTTALRLKSDSFVVESNVHFPTDYNLLWDCARKCLDTVSKFLEKHKTMGGWRKVDNWAYEIKGLMRELGKASSSGGKGKDDRVIRAASKYLKKTKALLLKLNEELPTFPMHDMGDLSLVITLEKFMALMQKHMDLVERRILNHEDIPHSEKLFSIFETFTEWVKKGKSRPSVELGKKLLITTDQYNLIVDHQIMHDQQDRDLVIVLADRLLPKHEVSSWSFDKGFWSKENKQLLQLEVPRVIMSKLGKRNAQEDAEEKSQPFRRLKNKHSTIESNINELEHRGLDRCPDRGILNYTRYISLGVCAYNLKKIGHRILEQERDALKAKHSQFRQAA
jgi:IS5 family transposase